MKKIVSLVIGVVVLLLLVYDGGAITKKGYMDSSGYLPEFNTSESMKKLQESFAKTTPLVKAFQQAGQELEESLKEYEKNPSVGLEAKIEKQLSDYVDKIVQLMDNFVADRDGIKWALTDVEREVGKFCAGLKSKSGYMGKMFNAQQKEIEKLKEELTKTARSIKADPENKELKKEFRNQLRKLRLIERYSAGYAANKKSLETWGKSLEKLHTSVSNVKMQVDTLLGALDEEREILGSAVELRAGRAKITALLNKGLLADGSSLSELGNKIKLLYESLNNFSEVSRMMDVEMSEDSAVNKAVMDVAESTDGGNIIPFVSDGEQLNAEIDFYSQR